MSPPRVDGRIGSGAALGDSICMAERVITERFQKTGGLLDPYTLSLLLPEL